MPESHTRSRVGAEKFVGGAWTVAGLLGLIAAAISCFNLAHMFLQFGLSAPFRALVDFYVNFTHPLVDIVKPIALSAISLFGISELPDWWHEPVVLYVLIGGALFRRDRPLFRGFSGMAIYEVSKVNSTLRLSLSRALMFSVLWPIYPLFVLILVPLYLRIWAFLWAGKRNGSSIQANARKFGHQELLLWTQEIAKTLLGAAIFIALNAATTN